MKEDFILRIPREGNMRRDAVIFTSPALKLEASAIEQLKNAASVPTTVHISATPDIHQGYGVPIGAVLGTAETVVPAAVGYDINCGMRMLTTGIRAENFRLADAADAFHRDIPLGEGKKNLVLSRADFEHVAERGVDALSDIKRSGHCFWEAFDKRELKSQQSRIEDGGSLKGDINAVSGRAIERGREQLGTLGGGNHFIEIQIVEEIYDSDIARGFNLKKGEITIMIHTGSRGFGHQIGGDYMKAANSITEARGSDLARKGLGFLYMYDKEGKSYLSAMNCGANFAFTNRFVLHLIVKAALQELYPEINLRLLYDVPHNILKVEKHLNRDLLVHRKGATRAFGKRRMNGTLFSVTGQPVLIPGSMGTASYVLSGVDDNDMSLSSVNHGAGRVMSRTEARGKFDRRTGKYKRPPAISDDQFKRAMKGIMLYAPKKSAVKEEAPQAYKDINEVVSVVTGAGLARKIACVRPLAVLKG